MSSANVELVKKAIGAAMARPRPDFDTVNSLFHRDHVYVPPESQLEEAEFRGARGWQSFLRDRQPGLEQASGALVTWEADLESAVDLDSDRVLGVARVRTRGSGSGVELDTRVWLLVTVRGGRVIRTECYSDEEQAREVARTSANS